MNRSIIIGAVSLSPKHMGRILMIALAASTLVAFVGMIISFGLAVGAAIQAQLAYLAIMLLAPGSYVAARWLAAHPPDGRHIPADLNARLEELKAAAPVEKLGRLGPRGKQRGRWLRPALPQVAWIAEDAIYVSTGQRFALTDYESFDVDEPRPGVCRVRFWTSHPASGPRRLSDLLDALIILAGSGAAAWLALQGWARLGPRNDVLSCFFMGASVFLIGAVQMATQCGPRPVTHRMTGKICDLAIFVDEAIYPRSSILEALGSRLERSTL